MWRGKCGVRGNAHDAGVGGGGHCIGWREFKSNYSMCGNVDVDVDALPNQRGLAYSNRVEIVYAWSVFTYRLFPSLRFKRVFYRSNLWFNCTVLVLF